VEREYRANQPPPCLRFLVVRRIVYTRHSLYTTYSIYTLYTPVAMAPNMTRTYQARVGYLPDFSGYEY
jgi:hypothetical protein